MKKIACILLFVLSFAACSQNVPYVYRGFPKQYQLVYENIHGHCYDSIPRAVVSLDLYSEGLSLDSRHRIRGTGYNLYISDIFVPDSLLEEGMYISIPRDSLASFDYEQSAFRFLPGRTFEGTPHGIYLMQIENSDMVSITVFDSGFFTYRNDSLQLTLYYRDFYGRANTYVSTYSGSILPWQNK